MSQFKLYTQEPMCVLRQCFVDTETGKDHSMSLFLRLNELKLCSCRWSPINVCLCVQSALFYLFHTCKTNLQICNSTSLTCRFFLQKIMVDEIPIGATFKPVMQIVGLKLISKGSTPAARYRVLLQDGINSSSSKPLFLFFLVVLLMKSIASQYEWSGIKLAN